MQKQYVAVELLRKGAELSVTYFSNEAFIGLSNNERTCMYDVLGLVYEPIFLYFKNKDLSKKRFNALYDEKEFVLRKIRGSDLFEKEDFGEKIAVLVNASSLVQETYFFDKKTEPTGIRILPLNFKEFNDNFEENDELNLEKLSEMTFDEKSDEYVIQQDYIAFENLISEIESNQIEIEDIPFIYAPIDGDDILYGL